MGIREDFLAERTEELENGFPGERWEALSFTTLGIRQSKTAAALLQEETRH